MCDVNLDSREGFDSFEAARIEGQAELEATHDTDGNYVWSEDAINWEEGMRSDSLYEDDCDDCADDDDFDPDWEHDGQPDEYTEWQDYMGGDDWDHGQYDEY